MTESPPLVAIDVGSAAVSVVIAVPTTNGLNVLGCGQKFHTGAPRGIIAELEETSRAVRAASEEAEAMAGTQVERAVIGIGGPPVVGFRAHSSVPITDRQQTVTVEDRDRALGRCTGFNQPRDYRVLDIIPREYVLDGQPGVIQPVGMPATRLDAHAFVLYAHKTHVETLIQAVNRAGVMVDHVYYEPLAAAAAAMSDEERAFGCLLVDIGFGATEWALFVDGSVLCTGSTPVAGRSFTNDLATMLHTTTHAAERLKAELGVGLEDQNEDRAVEVPPLGGDGTQVIPVSMAVRIIEARARDLLVQIVHPLRKQGLESYPRAGLVLTGGGARLAGLTGLGEEFFGQRVRLGAPLEVEGLSELVDGPEWSVACGLIRLHAIRRSNDAKHSSTRLQERILSWLRHALGEVFEMGGGS